MRAAVACCLLAACGFDHGKSTLGDGGPGGEDAADALMLDAPPGCMTYSTQFDTCAIGVGLGTMAVELDGMSSYDTDTGELVTSTGMLAVPHEVITTTDGEIDVMFVASFTIHGGATLRVTGASTDRPFGIASLGAVKVDGTIDLSSNGAGARDDNDCTSDGTKGEDDDGGGGGGGGGGFGGNGGNGGPGDGNDDEPGGHSDGGNGGTAVDPPPMHVLGGCDGGDGGFGSGATSRGIGGDGGGAIFIATPVMMSIGPMGVINANGGGGTTGSNLSGGGGGGGSGGFILLEASMITNAGKLVANGGGGGEGGDTFFGDNGDPGQVSADKAQGGKALAPEGGDGGDGGAGGTADGASTTQLKAGGGGGGGGGVGFIATTVEPMMMGGGAVISPPRRAWP